MPEKRYEVTLLTYGKPMTYTTTSAAEAFQLASDILLANRMLPSEIDRLLINLADMAFGRTINIEYPHVLKIIVREEENGGEENGRAEKNA